MQNKGQKLYIIKETRKGRHRQKQINSYLNQNVIIDKGNCMGEADRPFSQSSNVHTLINAGNTSALHSFTSNWLHGQNFFPRRYLPLVTLMMPVGLEWTDTGISLLFSYAWDQLGRHTVSFRTYIHSSPLFVSLVCMVRIVRIGKTGLASPGDSVELLRQSPPLSQAWDQPGHFLNFPLTR